MTLLWILALLVLVTGYFAVAYGRRAVRGEFDLRDLYAALVFAVLAVGFLGVFHWIRTGAPRPPRPMTWGIFALSGAGYLAAVGVRVAHLLRARRGPKPPEDTA